MSAREDLVVWLADRAKSLADAKKAGDLLDALVAEAKAEERGAIFAEIRRDPDNALDVICWLERKADRCRT